MQSRSVGGSGGREGWGCQILVLDVGVIRSKNVVSCCLSCESFVPGDHVEFFLQFVPGGQTLMNQLPNSATPPIPAGTLGSSNFFDSSLKKPKAK